VVDIRIRPTEPADVALLAENMRQVDIDELHAGGHFDLHAAVGDSFKLSLMCWSYFDGDELLCIMGVAPISMVNGIGAPWMLGTPAMLRCSRILVRIAPGYISTMLEVFPRLMNCVHVDNKTSVRWLQRIGFKLFDPVVHPTTGALFYPFEMRA
jgi:hypothetical protein